MSLPSQSPRGTAPTRTHMRHHRRRGLPVRAILIAFFLVVIVAGGAWWLTRDRDGTGPLGPDSAGATGDRLLDDPFAPDASLRAESTPQPRTGSLTNRPTRGKASRETEPPVVIAQGGGSDTRNEVGNAGGSETGFEPGQPITIEKPRSLGESLAQAPTTPTTAPPPTDEEPAPSRPTGAFERVLVAAELRLDADDPVAARSILNEALLGDGFDEISQSRLRAMLTEINQELVFSATVVPGDPMTETYEIVSGDSLSKLPGKLGLGVDWRLLARINAIPDPNKIRLGQKIKLVRGPFHAVVDKSDYRLDLYAGPPEEEGAWVYIRSFRVGLGEDDGTPTGSFVVKRQSKLVNPYWVNPRTGERFAADNPKNPIGERWIGIAGLGADAVKTGYGLHGTIDPGSIGQQKSMGCVRMHGSDVELVYEVLVEGISRVRIQD